MSDVPEESSDKDEVNEDAPTVAKTERPLGIEIEMSKKSTKVIERSFYS